MWLLSLPCCIPLPPPPPPPPRQCLSTTHGGTCDMLGLVTEASLDMGAHSCACVSVAFQIGSLFLTQDAEKSW